MEQEELLAKITKDLVIAVQEIKRLEKWIDDLQSGMYINCVYCGHQYGPSTEAPMREVLEQHIASCPKHPLSKALAEVARLDHLHKLDHSLADQWQKKTEALMDFFIGAEYRNLPEIPNLSPEQLRRMGEVASARIKEIKVKADAYDNLSRLAAITVANAVIGPASRMHFTTDCYHVPLDDVDALREAVKP